jgi:polyphosphate kinase
MSLKPSLPTPPTLLSAPDKALIHRDLSWLQFNERVLGEAKDQSNPLLERLRFLSISSSNLDEFFMIRVATLGRAIALAEKNGNKREVATQKRIRASIFKSVERLVAIQKGVFDSLAKELAAQKIRMVTKVKPSDPDYQIGKEIFEREIFTRLDSPEPFRTNRLSSLGNLQLAAIFPNNIWVLIPKSLPAAFLHRPDSGEASTIFFLDHLLYHHLGPAFNLTGIPGVLRITRDGDFTADLLEEDTESIPDAVRSSLSTRDRGRPVRLQASTTTPAALLDQGRSALKLDALQVQPPGQGQGRTLCLHGLWSVVNQLTKSSKMPAALTYPSFVSAVPKPLRDPKTLFETLKSRDFLLHHPYDSFDAYVTWIQAACADPKVTQIEQTVYRMDALSPVIEALKTAAKAKKVRVMIELRARFDELNNLTLADELKKAGVEVAFGFGALKLHAKVALVTRVEDGTICHYTHLSTGNYNAATARQYTDMAIITANAEIGADARLFFDSVSAGKVPTAFKSVVSAPTKLHRRVVHLIEEETRAAQEKKPARIFAKVNALVDEAIIDSLYRASKAGVQVDLVVRGACSLIPGVPGLSENIRVISIIDRFLEHSRIYFFESSRTLYLSSADWMPRNFFSRLELAFPVLDARIFEYIERVVIPTYLTDTAKARELTPQGNWKRRPAMGTHVPVRCQFFFKELALNEYKGTPLEFS